MDAPYFLVLREVLRGRPSWMEFLEQDRHSVRWAVSIDEAIALIQERTPVVVLFDSGRIRLKDFCRAVSDINNNSPVPILALSCDADDLENVTTNGYAGWVEKFPDVFSSVFFKAKLKMYLNLYESRTLVRQFDDYQLQLKKEKQNLTAKLNESQNLAMLGRLSSGVAHDFNNILGGILGYAELASMRYGLENPEIRKFADSIIGFTKRASELTKEILVFANPNPEESQPINTHFLITEVMDLLSHLIDKNYSLVKDLRAQFPVVVGESAKLQNALINLSLNARDAMPAGGTLAFITDNIVLDEEKIRRQGMGVRTGEYLVITVEDTGTGMDKETLSHMFEPFFTTKEKGKGTGLGLPSVQNALKELNGDVTVHSVPGEGTRFNLYLPTSHERATEAHHTTEVPVLVGDARILLVDDEEALRDILSEMLTDAGYKVKVLSDGLEAVNYYKEHHSEIDLIIIDLNLPKMKGQDCFKAFKAVNPNVKAILSSGHHLQDVAKEALESGMMAFIQKPFEMTKLLKVVAKVLKKQPIS